MNWYFWRVWIPLQVLTLLGLVSYSLGLIDLNLWYVISFWFALGPLGIGVGFHRLFSHRSFETWIPIEVGLALLGTLACYAPVSFWASAHQYHHLHADTNKDPSSPDKGFWESFLMHRMRTSMLRRISVNNYPYRRLYGAPILMTLSNYFVPIIYCFMILLLMISPSLLLAYLIAVFLEHFRINAVNYLSHKKIWGSYRNYDTEDTSYNNWWLGLLTLGFSWHNNHHHRPRRPSNHHKWWEIDVEALVCKLITKR